MSLKISIIVPCFNGEQYLSECLESIKAQTYDNVEVIFVDNESTDSSVEVARSVQVPGMIMSSAENIYPHTWTECVEEGMKLMSGDYFTIVACDDFLDPEYIANVANIIEQLDRRILCMQSPLKRRGPGVDFLGTIEGSFLGYPFRTLEEFRSALLVHCAVNTPSMVYSKSLYEDNHITYKSEEYLGASDYDLYCQFIDKGIFIYNCEQYLGYNYRVHPQQNTWGMEEKAKKGKDYDTAIRSYWEKKWKK